MSSWLLVGLGNPGAKYQLTRHNAGYLVAEEIANRANAQFQLAKGMSAAVASTVIGAAGLGIVPGEKLLIAKPSTFMNNSGRSVAALCQFYKISPDRLLVVHDELDLDLGQLRCKFGGSDNGHNGLKSVRQHLHTGDYYRLRFGIGRPPGRMDAADYVLRPFANSEDSQLDLALTAAADACLELITNGLAAAQNKFNS